MVEKTADLEQPTGFRRLLFRAPIWLYKLHLGWLLGKRMLLMSHTGRKSGLPRQVVLEVVRHDPSKNVFYIAAAWGEKSDWVKNIRANPVVEIQVGLKNYSMLAEQLTPQEGESTLLDYSRRHPTAMVNLANYMGYQLDGSEEDFRELGRMLLMFSLTPYTQGNSA